MDFTDRLAQTLQREVVRRKRLTAVLVLASCAATALSAVTFRERQQFRRLAAEQTACERACREAPRDAGSPAFFVPARTLDLPLDIPAVLDVQLAALCPGGDIRDTTLAEAAVQGAVHLVNLWQLPCNGCIKEFPLLARALAAAGHVRFLPVDDPSIRVPAGDYRTAQTQHGMPPPTLPLIDRGPDGARLLPAVTPWVADNHVVYPFSFVLDCRQRLRWWKLGALGEAEADALADLLTDIGRDRACSPDSALPAVCDRPLRDRAIHHDRRDRIREIVSPTDDSPAPTSDVPETPAPPPADDLPPQTPADAAPDPAPPPRTAAVAARAVPRAPAHPPDPRRLPAPLHRRSLHLPDRRAGHVRLRPAPRHQLDEVPCCSHSPPRSCSRTLPRTPLRRTRAVRGPPRSATERVLSTARATTSRPPIATGPCGPAAANRATCSTPCRATCSPSAEARRSTCGPARSRPALRWIRGCAARATP